MSFPEKISIFKNKGMNQNLERAEREEQEPWKVLTVNEPITEQIPI